MSKAFRDRLYKMDYHHPKVNDLVQWGEWFFRFAANNDRSRGTQLVIAGQTGCGKTRVARRTFEQLQVWGVEMSLKTWNGTFPYVRFIDWAPLAESDTSSRFDEALEWAALSEIVFIDDVGAEADRFKNGENISRLRQILSQCERKWLFLTTNLGKPEFEKVYDMRVADRLCGAHWCNMATIPSYRPKLKRSSELKKTL